MEQDRNLLFGVFAVQLKMVAPSQIMAAAGAWAADPSKDLPDRLLADGALSPSDRDLIQGLVDHAVNAHDGNAATTLARFGGDERIQETFYGSIVRSDSGQAWLNSTQNLTVLSETGEPPGLSETPGRYTRESEHARGGMGRVLLVHDEFVGRDIALKELLPSLASSSESGETPDSPARASAHFAHRFLQEARVTGQLEHPSIVPVYELGRRIDGSLYYTMKLVKGDSLSRAIQNAGTLRERLKLLPHFVDLCQAIAYAHSRGVIHRDIKPGNVMVGEFGETVVIDWGLAKVLGKEDIHAEGFDEAVQQVSKGISPAEIGTVYGHAIGTPAYMPPEQAKGQLELVDMRSDAYSLGAVLYELLSGQPPFKGDALASILSKVVNEPPTPIRDIVQDAPAELVAICERAMQKQTSRRYGSPKELADEVQRFLNGAVVQAYEYSFVEHSKRLIQQHKGAFATGALGLVAVIAISVIGYVRVGLERNDALASRDRAKAAEERSEEQMAMVFEAFRKLTYEVPDTFGDIPEARPRVIAMLERNVEDMDRLFALDSSPLGARVLKANSLWGVGRGWLALGEYDKAVARFDAASEIFEELIEQYTDDINFANNFVTFLQGRALLYGIQGEHDAASAAVERVITIRERLVQQYPDSADLANSLAGAHNSMGLFFSDRRDTGAALAAYQQARNIRERLVEQDPGHFIFAGDLARVLRNIGGILSGMPDRRDEALALHQQAKVVWEGLLQQDPDNVGSANAFAVVHISMGLLFQGQGKNDEALAAYEQAKTIWERLLEQDPGNAQYATYLAQAHQGMGYISAITRETEAAAEHLAQSFSLFRGLVERDPGSRLPWGDGNPTGINQLPTIALMLVGQYSSLGRYEDGLQLALDYRELCEIRLDADPENRRAQRNRAEAIVRLGDAYGKLDRTDEARGSYEEAQALLRDLIAVSPNDKILIRLLRRAERNLERIGAPTPN